MTKNISMPHSWHNVWPVPFPNFVKRDLSKSIMSASIMGLLRMFKSYVTLAGKVREAWFAKIRKYSYNSSTTKLVCHPSDPFRLDKIVRVVLTTRPLLAVHFALSTTCWSSFLFSKTVSSREKDWAEWSFVRLGRLVSGPITHSTELHWKPVKLFSNKDVSIIYDGNEKVVIHYYAVVNDERI